MPDDQTLNRIASAYGVSGLLGGSGGGGFFNPWNILAGIIFSIIGWYGFWNGKKERNGRGMVIGIVLMAYTLFVSSVLWTIIIGVALTAALYLWRD